MIEQFTLKMFITRKKVGNLEVLILDISRFRIWLQMHLLHKLQPFKYVAICYFVGKLVECSFFTQLTLSYSILEMLCHSNRKLIQHNCRFRWQSTCHMF